MTADRPAERPERVPSARRLRVAALLVTLREGTGLNQTEFGARLGTNQPKMSRLETGRQVPTVAEATAWADAAGADKDAHAELVNQVEVALREPTGMHEYVRGGAARRQRAISADEHAVSVQRDLQNSLVPGLLQTAAYTRRQSDLAVLLRPELAEDQAARLVEWQRRKEVLHEPGHRFEFLITEGALRWRPGPDDAPHVLAAQLRQLASLSTLDNVRIGVLPWRVHTRVLPESFILYGEPGVDPDAWVHTATKAGVTEYRDPDEIAVFRRTWDLLGADALFDDEARAELDRIAADG